MIYALHYCLFLILCFTVFLSQWIIREQNVGKKVLDKLRLNVKYNSLDDATNAFRLSYDYIWQIS